MTQTIALWLDNLQSHYQTWHNALGLMTWPLILAAVLSILIIIERSGYFIGLSLYNPSTKKLLHRYRLDNVDNQDAFLNQSFSSLQPLALLTQKLLRHLNSHTSTDAQVEQILIDKHLFAERCQRGLGILRLLSMISPMLGLLGTVLGLITMFKTLAKSEEAISINLISAGLSHALYTTAVGLIIALLGLCCYQLAQLFIARREFILLEQAHAIRHHLLHHHLLHGQTTVKTALDNPAAPTPIHTRERLA